MVALRIRGCHYYDKRVLAARAGAQPAQYFRASVSGHVDVQQDEMRTGRLRIGIRPLEKLHGLFAIVRDVDLRFDSGFLKRLPDQEHVRPAVFSNQNLPGRLHLSLVRGGA
jgi:hypothetical protein